MGKASTPIKNKRIPVTKGRVSGFLNWGSDNLFPQKWLEVVRSSTSAVRCLEVKAAFIEGNGFTDRALSQLVVGSGNLTLDDLLEATAESAAELEGFCWHIRYNALGQPVSVKPVDFSIVRLKEPDDLNNITHAGIFPYLGSQLHKKREAEHSEHPLFNPDPEVVIRQIEAAGGIDRYQGQLLYVALKKLGSDYYHTPVYFSAEKDVQTDAELSEYDYRSVANGFNSPGMLTLLDTVNEDDYNPYNDPNSIESQIAQAQGAENASTIMINRVKSKAEFDATKFESFTDTSLPNRYEKTSDRVAIKISRAINVPAVLANILTGTALFASDKELEIAAKFMQLQVNKTQRRISREFKRLFANWHRPVTSDFLIENLNYFDTSKQAQQAG